MRLFNNYRNNSRKVRNRIKNNYKLYKINNSNYKNNKIIMN